MASTLSDSHPVAGIATVDGLPPSVDAVRRVRPPLVVGTVVRHVPSGHHSIWTGTTVNIQVPQSELAGLLNPTSYPRSSTLMNVQRSTGHTGTHAHLLYECVSQCKAY